VNERYLVYVRGVRGMVMDVGRVGTVCVRESMAAR
jgi:hypothetical protein